MAGFESFGQVVKIDATGTRTMSDSTGGDGPFVCQCKTCGEAKRRVDHQTAQEFFADHHDQDHAPEIFRIEHSGGNSPADADRTESGGAAQPD